MSSQAVSFPAAADPVADHREQLGIFLEADTVLCEDCNFIGLANDGRCRKCTSASISPLWPIVERVVDLAGARFGGN